MSNKSSLGMEVRGHTKGKGNKKRDETAKIVERLNVSKVPGKDSTVGP